MSGVDANVWTRFVETAAAFPDKAALIHEERRWSFSQLHMNALRCGAGLIDAKIGPNDRVLGSARNSLELAATLLGVWAAGAIPVFVHAESPLTHLTHAAKVTEPSLCLVDKGIDAARQALACQVSPLDETIG